MRPFTLASLLTTHLVVPTAMAVDIKVKSSGGNATSGHQYGFLHEDINNSGDGGIYAELIRNRAFQYSEFYPANLSGWSPVNGANLALNRLDSPLSDALPISVTVTPSADAATDAAAGLLNDGYWGMHVACQTYTGSFWVYGGYEGVFTAELRSAMNDDVFGSVEVESKAKADEWVEHAFELVPTIDAPNSNNTFALKFDPAVCVYLPCYLGDKQTDIVYRVWPMSLLTST